MSIAMPEGDINNRLKAVQSRIAAAERRTGREPGSVLLVAVTKTHPVDVAREAFRAGLRHFGENRVEEAEAKIAAAGAIGLDGATWHMIGHVQGRKAKKATELFSWLHSLDSVKLAHHLNDALHEAGRQISVLLEVNLSGEIHKNGFDLRDWPQKAEQEEPFLVAVEQIISLTGLHIEGLMTLPPYASNPEHARPFFGRLRMMRDRLCNVFGPGNWQHLSMGMSADYEIAIEEGATIIRLGTALFGPRSG